MIGEKREKQRTEYEKTKSLLRVSLVLCVVLAVVALCALRGNFALQQERAAAMGEAK